MSEKPTDLPVLQLHSPPSRRRASIFRHPDFIFQVSSLSPEFPLSAFCSLFSVFCFLFSVFCFVKLAVFSHKPCWRSAASPTGYATDGGFPFQMQALSELFDETRLVLPFHDHAGSAGEVPLMGNSLTVVPLTARTGAGLASKLSFLPWALRNGITICRELRAADAIHAPVPGDVGTVGMLLAWAFRKPLFVRHCGNWLRPRTGAERFWRWFMETTAGGRNVMLATGGTGGSPSSKNPNVHWIFASSLTQQELDAYACPRTYPLQKPINGPPGFGVRQPSGAFEQVSGTGTRQRAAAPQDDTPPKPASSRFNIDAPVRLIIVARQEMGKGAGTIVKCLPALIKRFPGISLEIVGEGSGIPGFKHLAKNLGIEERVRFSGKLNHEQVMLRLREAHLFVFPTTSSDGFPKAVLEGLASGLPVVATPVSVLPKILGHGCGVLMDEATPAALVRAVEQALADAGRYEHMSVKAIETARHYSIETWRDTIGGYLSAVWGPLKRNDEGGRRKAESRSPVVS
jgi:glycosyltransferase involved in cell wall biosynthesis